MTSPDVPGDDAPYGPDPFMSDNPVNLLYQTNGTLPGAATGGVIEATKRAIVTAVREAAKATDLQIAGQAPYIDLEYPLKEEQYPGIWVQYALTKFVRAGIAQEVTYWDPVTSAWTPIQTFSYDGRVTLSIVALKNKDRDQLADAILAMLAFSRTPETWLTQTQQDTQQYRGLLTSLSGNAYVSLTPNTDIITGTGPGVDVGVPWQPDVLAYTDGYSFDLHGQTMLRFMHDGAYTLNRIDIDCQAATPEQLIAAQQALVTTLAPTTIGKGVSQPTWRTL